MTSHGVSDTLDSLSPADGESRTFIVTSIRRDSIAGFTLACHPAAMMSCGPARMWALYDTLSGWVVGETRQIDPPAVVTAMWSDADGWTVTGLSKQIEAGEG